MGQGGPPPTSGWNAAVAALPNLWGWWKLDETAGAAVVAADASGNSHNGSYTAAGTQSAGLFAGSSVAQASLGGRVNLPSYTLAAAPVFSIGAMIRANATASVQSILSSDVTGNRKWQFTKSAAHVLGLTIVTPTPVGIVGTTSINDGNPHFVVMVFDQTLAAASGRAKIYLDGSLEVASSTAITMSGSSGTVPAIGSRNNTATQELWRGAIDECFIVDGAISSANVAALWAARNL